MKRIPLAGPSITEQEVAYVADAVRTAWYENANVYNERFEQEFARYIGVRHAVSLPSCTSAIHLALLALDIGPGDEVIVPEITWIASAAPITYVGATPVFADIDPDTWCLSPESFAACITPRTRAVIPVDLYGGMPDMDAILAIAERYQVAVVEDAAEAIGSEYHTRKAGSFGAAGVFSFHGSKTLTTGEGGMLVTDSDDLHDRVQFLRDHGRSPDDRTLWNTEIGYKYKMSSLQAALGLAQLQRVDELVHAKRAIFSWYREHLAGVEGLALNVEPPGTLNSYWMSTIVGVGTDKLPKEHIIKALRASNIDSRPFFYPLSSLPAFKDIAVVADYRERNRVAYQLSPYGVNLPSGLNLTEETVARVCAALTTILQGETA